MPDAPKKSGVSTLEFIALFIVLFFVTNTGLKYFFPAQFGEKNTAKQTITLTAGNVSVGGDPVVTIHNDTDKDLPLPKRCPQPPVDITYLDHASDGTEKRMDLMANDSVLPCVELTLVKAHSSAVANLAGWKYVLFGRTGEYEAGLDLPPDTLSGAHLTAKFSVNEPNFLTKIFRTFVEKPLFNGLIFIASWMPNHNLGLAIIVLTLLVKLVLLVPNQHALEGQRKLQLLQPRLDELKKKYPGDPKRVQEETMKVWKEMKINPLQSCLPTLLQFPILIGLFYVIRNGVAIDTSRHLLYSAYESLPSPFFGHMFLGFDLLQPSIWIMPPLLVILQFIQMKMMMKKAKPKKDEIVVQPAGKKSWIPEMNQQTVMTYVLPLMIGFFALKFPAAVSLYWGISTLFGIGQQYYVMQEKLKV